MKDVIKELLNNNFTEYRQDIKGYVNFKELTELLNDIYNDSRYKVKVKATTTKTNSFIIVYRNKEFYCSFLTKEWNVELNN